jgi:RHS repeat-associated protein
VGGFGKQTDSTTGLILMGARPYDPATGRFLSVDPIDGGSLNNYDYAGQDPIDNYDLGGLACSKQQSHSWTWHALSPGCLWTALKDDASGGNGPVMQAVTLTDTALLVKVFGATFMEAVNPSLTSGWAGTNMSTEESFAYHFARHGAGHTIEEYAEAAQRWAENPAGVGQRVTLADGTVGMRYRTPGGGPGGILNAAGKIISFWYK